MRAASRSTDACRRSAVVARHARNAAIDSSDQSYVCRINVRHPSSGRSSQRHRWPGGRRPGSAGRQRSAALPRTPRHGFHERHRRTASSRTRRQLRARAARHPRSGGCHCRPTAAEPQDPRSWQDPRRLRLDDALVRDHPRLLRHTSRSIGHHAAMMPKAPKPLTLPTTTSTNCPRRKDARGANRQAHRTSPGVFPKARREHHATTSTSTPRADPASDLIPALTEHPRTLNGGGVASHVGRLVRGSRC